MCRPATSPTKFNEVRQEVPKTVGASNTAK